MFAGAMTIVLSTINFPNGGHGFLGRTSNSSLVGTVAASGGPSSPVGDTAYYRYTVDRRARSCSCSRCCTSRAQAGPRVGVDPRERAGRARRRREHRVYKLWAFALASFMTGVAGCLLAAQIGVPRAITFQTQDSLTLLATALIGGIFSLWGAVVAGDLQPAPAVLLPGAVGRSTRTSC